MNDVYCYSECPLWKWMSYEEKMQCLADSAWVWMNLKEIPYRLETHEECNQRLYKGVNHGTVL